MKPRFYNKRNGYIRLWDMMSSHQITEDTLYKLSGSHLPELDVNQRCAAPPLFHPLSAAHLRDYVIHFDLLECITLISSLSLHI